MKQIIDHVRDSLNDAEDGLFDHLFPDYIISYCYSLTEDEQMQYIAAHLGGEINTTSKAKWLAIFNQEFVPRIVDGVY